MQAFQYTRASGKKPVALPSPEEILLSLSEPLLETGDIKKALQKIITRGEGKKLKGLEELLAEVRNIKASFFKSYNPQSALEALQKDLQRQKGWGGWPEPDRKGGARLLDIAEEREKSPKKPLTPLAQLVSALQHITRTIPFTGSKPVSPEGAHAFIERLDLILRVEKDLQRAVWGYDLTAMEDQHISDLLGEEATATWKYLRNIKRELEQSGLLEEWKNTYRLTRKGFYIISSKILKEIFDLLKKDLFGKHATIFPSEGGIDIATSRPYKFGLPLHINLSKTLMNAAIRQGRTPRLSLIPEDFEVYDPEYDTRSATVLILDMSQSMKDRNNFLTAKKVALAFNDLIRRKFPRDYLGIIGFSTLARRLLPTELPYLHWDAEQSYTNIQDALRLSRRLLKREGSHNKQIILITDGEPTAHYEGDKLYFQFPPHPETVKHTLEEIKQCTREGIIINTFMMVKSNPLTNFVEEVTKINSGQAYYADADHLGEYIILDHLLRKNKKAR
ncbi:MAG TPA: VWA domain-containing protein [Thermodesulfobacteriota bacterium]|nr:VWA domain-containing protein [Thermodesulfobacteriota bacterium]